MTSLAGAELRVPRDLYAALHAHVTQAQASAGYLLCGVMEAGDRLVFLGREWWPVRPRYRIISDRGLTWHPNFDVAMLNRAQRERLGCVLIHHHSDGSPPLSGADRESCDSLLPFLSSEAPQRPHAFAVMGQSGARGPVYRAGRLAGEITDTVVVGSSVDRWTASGESRAIGLDELRVGIAGGGSSGARVIEQLADAGVGAFVFADGEETLWALRECDVVVSCLDRSRVRERLNRFCKRYLIPLIDLGLEVSPARGLSPTTACIPGRVSKVQPDGPCLRCQGVVADASPQGESSPRPAVVHAGRELPDSAVATLNGVVASIAVSEVLQILTGFAGADLPNCGWIYDGVTGAVERVHKRFRGCAVCVKERAAGDP